MTENPEVVPKMPVFYRTDSFKNLTLLIRRDYGQLYGFAHYPHPQSESQPGFPFLNLPGENVFRKIRNRYHSAIPTRSATIRY